jgi:hypothetical protein
LLTVAGELDAAREFAQRLSESEDPIERERFRRRVLEIDRERVLRHVDAVAATFEQRFGRKPLDLGELIAQGMLEQPVDPMGGTISFDAAGHAQVTSGKRLVLHMAVGESLPELP